MTLLSGGEQALTAMALIFAVFLTNPSPICVLDEVDAPLDDANVERYCDLLDEMARQTETRFVVITHNPITMALYPPRRGATRRPPRSGPPAPPARRRSSPGAPRRWPGGRVDVEAQVRRASTGTRMRPSGKVQLTELDRWRAHCSPIDRTSFMLPERNPPRSRVNT